MTKLYTKKMFDVRFDLSNLKDWSVTLSANIFDYNLSYNHSKRLSAGQDVSIDSIRFGLNFQDYKTELKNTFASSKSTKYSGLGLASFGEPFNYQFGDNVEKKYKPYNVGVSYNWLEFNSVKSDGYGIDFTFEQNDEINVSGSYYQIENNEGYTLAGNYNKTLIKYGTTNGNGLKSDNIYLQTFIDEYGLSYFNDDSTFNGNNVENKSISLGYNITNFLPPIDEEELFLGLKYNF